MSTNISLTPELENYAKAQVSSGLYNSVSEFMRDAVRQHLERNIEQNLYLKAMQQELTQAAADIDKDNISAFNMREISDKAFNNID